MISDEHLPFDNGVKEGLLIYWDRLVMFLLILASPFLFILVPPFLILAIVFDQGPRLSELDKLSAGRWRTWGKRSACSEAEV